MVGGSCFYFYFLQELKAHLSGEFEKENCTDANDVPKGDNVGAMFQGESKTIEEEILLPLGTKLKEIFSIIGYHPKMLGMHYNF